VTKQGTISSRRGVFLLALLAVAFAGNHVGARLAFDHGTSIPAAVAVRSGITALAMFVLMRMAGVTIGLDRRVLARGVGIGALVALQSYCLYSAVARIPVALALLAFNTYPLLLVLLIWATGGGRPSKRVLIAIPAALLGLLLALDVLGSIERMSGRWSEIGAGIVWSMGASLSFTLVLHFTARGLRDLDGRLRSMLTMGVAAIITGLAGAATHSLSLPADAQGWLGLGLLTLLYGSAISVMFAIVPRLAVPGNIAALNVEPVVALFLAWAILGQAVGGTQILGALGVVGAISLIATDKSRSR